MVAPVVAVAHGDNLAISLNKDSVSNRFTAAKRCAYKATATADLTCSSL